MTFGLPKKSSIELQVVATTTHSVGSHSPPLEKGCEPTANPLNQYHSPLGKGADVYLPPLGVVWVAPFRQGRSVRYHSTTFRSLCSLTLLTAFSLLAICKSHFFFYRNPLGTKGALTHHHEVV